MPRRLTTYVLLTLLAIGAIAGFVWLRNGGGGPPPLDTGAFVVDGTSDQLKSTVIVPTLDTPTEPGKNVVWCSSFPLAWKKLEQNVTRGPVRLDGAQAFADRLHADPSVESDLPPGSLFADAGLVKDGIVERIRDGMAERFPDRPVPTFNVPANGAVAFAHLEVSSKFEHPYFGYDGSQPFTSSDSSTQQVRAFGIRSKDDYAYYQLRSQAGVLFRPRGEIVPAEFVLDLNANDGRDQIIVALVERKPTLAEQLVDLNAKIAAHKNVDEYWRRFGPNDTLLVPNIGFRIEHHFRELEVNPITTAFQMTQFLLNRSGADLASETKVRVSPISTHYHFDRPFLVVMKRRDRERPYFVAWIDNAELLEK